MNLLNKILGKNVNPSENNNTIVQERYLIPFFKEARLQKEIALNGYCKAQMNNSRCVLKLIEFYEQFEQNAAPYIKDSFIASGRIDDPQLRSFVVENIRSILDQDLQLFFHQDSTSIFSGSFLIKPTGNKSDLNPHQDSSLVDESRYFSVYAWIPLCDTNRRNGTLHLLPGSHLWKNQYRSLNIPWMFDKYTDLIKKYWIPIDVKLGEVIFFDSALIHGSSPNKTTQKRIAVNSFIKRLDAPFIHHYMDKNSTDKTIEEYLIELDFFNNCNIMERPPDKYKLNKLIKYDPEIPTKSQVKEMMKSKV